MEAGDEEEEKKGKKTKKIKGMNTSEVELNKMKPIWTRNPSNTAAKKCSSSCMSLTNNWEDHLAVKQFSIGVNLNSRLSFSFLNGS
jgi:molecular chaperone HtpG